MRYSESASKSTLYRIFFFQKYFFHLIHPWGSTRINMREKSWGDHSPFLDGKQFSKKNMRYRVDFDADPEYRIRLVIKVKLECDSKWGKWKSAPKNGQFSQYSANIKIWTVRIFWKPYQSIERILKQVLIIKRLMSTLVFSIEFHSGKRWKFGYVICPYKYLICLAQQSTLKNYNNEYTIL